MGVRNGTIGGLIGSIRKKFGMTQDEFSGQCGIPLRTVQNWEQGKCDPDQLSVLFLRLLEKEPHMVMKLLRRHGLL